MIIYLKNQFVLENIVNLLLNNVEPQKNYIEPSRMGAWGNCLIQLLGYKVRQLWSEHKGNFILVNFNVFHFL